MLQTIVLPSVSENLHLCFDRLTWFLLLPFCPLDVLFWGLRQFMSRRTSRLVLREFTQTAPESAEVRSAEEEGRGRGVQAPQGVTHTAPPVVTRQALRPGLQSGGAPTPADACGSPPALLSGADAMREVASGYRNSRALMV